MSYPWTKMNVIPAAGMQFWHSADGITGVADGGNVTAIPDLSGNARDLAGSTTYPVLANNYINGQPAVVFAGTNNPLNYTGSLTTKHVFIVAAYADAAFPASGGLGEYAGLMSGINTGNVPVLVANPSSTSWLDLSLGSGYVYRRRDLVYPNASQSAAFSNALSIFEVTYATGFALDGVQLGRDRTYTNRKWKGPWCEQMGFSRVLNDNERLRIYQYLAMKYQIWQQNADGLNIFPFATNKARSAELDREHYLSEPYSGDPKALVRGEARRAFSLPFATRIQPEFEATEAFHGQHYPLTHFIYRDYRFFPPRETECRIASSLKEQGSDVTYRFNYTFDVVEIAPESTEDALYYDDDILRYF